MHITAVACGRTVDPMIQPPRQIVQHRLLVSGAETRVDFTSDVSFVITIGIFQIPNIRCRSDIHATLPRCDTTRPQQVLGEDVAFVKVAIAVCVFQQPQSANGFFALCRLVRIVSHFADIEVSVFVKTGRDRVIDQRFTGHKLHLETIIRFKRSQHFSDRFCGQWFEEFTKFFVRMLAFSGIVEHCLSHAEV